MTDLIDERTRSLGGEPSWIRSSLEACRHGSNLTAHDWLQLMSSSGAYVLADVLPGEDKIMDALYSLQEVFREVITNTSYVKCLPVCTDSNTTDRLWT